MTAGVPRLHAITDAAVLGRPDLAARAAALARSDDVAIHVRHAATARAAVEVTEQLLDVAAAVRARVIVNDRADIARATGAHGVHLPAAGLPIEAARCLLGPTALVGRSTHAPDEARRAADDGADYVFLGPIWSTTSHPERAALGLQALERARDAGIPLIAIGGVTPERTTACLEAGAHGVAAISALWQAADPGSAAARFLLSFGR